jgi:hypothetical protein
MDKQGITYVTHGKFPSELHIAIAIMVGIAIVYASLSANCATGGDCTFANGDLANWLLPRLHAMESAFWRSLPG